MRIEDLKAFVVLADVGTYHTAAEMLNITQPALSRRIQKLEKILSTTLLVRSTRRLRLTSAGLQFLEKIRPVVMDAETAIMEMHQTDMKWQGLIRIACLPSIGIDMLPAILRDLHGELPRVSFRIIDGNALEIIQMLMSGQVDIGIGMQLGQEAELSFTPLFHEEIGVVGHRDHPVTQMEHPRWSDLAAYPLAYNLGESGNRLILANHLEPRGIRLNWAHQIQSLFGALMVARSGIALAPAPSSFAAAASSRELVFCPVAEPLVERQLHLIERKDTMRSSYLQKIIDLIETEAARRRSAA